MKCRRRPLFETLESRTLLAANTVIDLLALYTPQAQHPFGSQSAILHFIQSAVASTNTVMANSLVPITIRLVGIHLETYTESNDLSTDLDRLDTAGDGFMDDVPALRNWFGADLVTLITSAGSPAGGGLETVGIGLELETPHAPGNDANAYTVVSQNSADAPDYTLAHEIGHNLGAAHSVDDTSDPGAAAYSHGYRFTGKNGVLYHDVMAYDPGQEIPYFSNPRITYQGVPEGNAATADASRVITEDAAEVSAYRSTSLMGALDIHSGGTVGGWAYDPRSLNAAVNVFVMVDGTFAKEESAGTVRTSLLSVLGTDNHAFSYTVGAGTHTVSVYGQDLTGKLVLLGTATVTNARPIGAIQALSASSIVGWAFDADVPNGGTMVNLAIDGVGITSTSANIFRGDLQATLGGTGMYGYVFSLPTLTPGLHRIDVYAIDNISGLVRIGSRTLQTNAPPRGNVDTTTSTTLAGWALDPNDFNTPIRIRYTIDNNAPVFATASNNRSDLAKYFPNTNHGFSISLPALPAGAHVITVYAEDLAAKSLTLIGRKTIVTVPAAGAHLPHGNLDIATTARLAGWVYDADAPGGKIMARVDIDGVAGTPFDTTLTRSDLAKTYGTAELGFDIPIGPLTGPHRVDLYAIDVPTGTAVLVASREVGDSLTFGQVLGINASGVVGWAYAQGADNQQATLRIDVDGMVGPLITASKTSPAIAAGLGASLGFSTTLPPLAAGTHTYTVYVLDPVTDQALLLKRAVIAIG